MVRLIAVVTDISKRKYRVSGTIRRVVVRTFSSNTSYIRKVFTGPGCHANSMVKLYFRFNAGWKDQSRGSENGLSI